MVDVKVERLEGPCVLLSMGIAGVAISARGHSNKLHGPATLGAVLSRGRSPKLRGDTHAGRDYNSKSAYCQSVKRGLTSGKEASNLPYVSTPSRKKKPEKRYCSYCGHDRAVSNFSEGSDTCKFCLRFDMAASITSPIPDPFQAQKYPFSSLEQ